MGENQELKNDILKAYYDANFEDVVKIYKTALLKNLEVTRSMVVKYRVEFEELKNLDQNTLKTYTQLKKFNSSILSLLTEDKKLLSYHYGGVFDPVYTHLNKEIEKQKKYFIVKESFNGYSFSKKFNPLLFIKKIADNISLGFNRWKKGFFNVFLRLFNKPLLDNRKYRVRRIPYRGMLHYYIFLETQNKLIGPFNTVMLNVSQILLKLWAFDEKMLNEIQNWLQKKGDETFEFPIKEENFTSLVNSVDEHLKASIAEIESAINQSVQDAFIKLDKAMAQVNTPDLPPKNFSANQLKENQEELKFDFNSSFEKWENTHTTLFDDWIVDIEVSLLYYSVMDLFGALNKQIDIFLSENLSFDIDSLADFINKSGKRILTATNIKELKQILRTEISKNKNEFVGNMLAAIIHKISGNFSRDIDKFKTQTMQLAANISDKRGFVKSKNYERGINNKDINWISPREMLNFEALPNFSKTMVSIEEYIENHLERARVKLISLGTVSSFSLESAQLMLKDKSGDLATCKKTITDGYGRAILNLEEATKELDQIKINPLEQLQEAIGVFHKDIQKLKNTDSILELNVKIVKIKALERSKKLRSDAREWFVRIPPNLLEFFKTKFLQSKEIVTDLKKKLGIISEKSQISHELSDFLGKTEEALKKLPYIYQRLYQLSPTSDERFFVGREEELEKIYSNYKSWLQDHYVTTAVIGEKGNGNSSLLLYALEKMKPEIEVIHLEVQGKIYTPKDYLKLFSKILGNAEFKGNEDIIEYINQLPENKIIILENLQHFYIKKVNGFICLKMLFDLMTSTSKKIFWVGTYTTHSWSYLEKTVDISTVYVNEVYLQRFTDETLEKVIYNRNYLSGFHVKFEASESNLASKSFNKLDEKEKQAYLRKHFFKDLNRMSNGNLSLSILYWLRSSNGINDEFIHIKSLQQIDISFNKELPSRNLFALHALLIHDGLTIKDYSLVFNCAEYIARNDLMPMLEKGLLIKPKEKFTINPIIFRQIVQLLQSHNFIN